MLNIDLMTEKEIIEIIHNEEFLKEITEGNVTAFCQGEEQTLELWHLVSRVSPANQDKDEIFNFSKLSKLIAKRIQPFVKKTSQNDTEQNLEVFDKAYYPLVQLLNKLSIKRTKELASNPYISKLLISPKINPGITYTAISRIERPSVLSELTKALNEEILKNKTEKLNIQAIKNILRKDIQQHKDSPGVKEHFKTEYQRIIDKEKYNEAVYKYYQSTKGILSHLLSNIITENQEKNNEQEIQRSIDSLNQFYETQEINKLNRR